MAKAGNALGLLELAVGFLELELKGALAGDVAVDADQAPDWAIIFTQGQYGDFAEEGGAIAAFAGGFP